jgi:hypothetical protein
MKQTQTPKSNWQIKLLEVVVYSSFSATTTIEEKQAAKAQTGTYKRICLY